MEKLINDLVSRETEGSYWDFKEKFSDLVSLMHDIICLSNVIHDGDRYLIFGVTNEFQVVGIESENYEKLTQANILDSLKAMPFANNCIPTIVYEKIIIQDKELIVISIKNIKNKPFYLTKKYHNLYAGAIYSRDKDTNTPVNSTANPNDVELMWKERFSLDLTCSDKFKQVLKDYKNWKYNRESSYSSKKKEAFYEYDKDMKLVFSKIENTNQWASLPWLDIFDINSRHVSTNDVEMIFTNTTIGTIKLYQVSYDYHIPQPTQSTIKLSDRDIDVFYYEVGSIEHAFLVHMMGVRNSNNDTYPSVVDLYDLLELPFFIINKEEVEDLVDDYKSKYTEFIKETSEINEQYETEVLNDHDNTKIQKIFLRWAFKRLKHKYLK